MCNKLFDIVPHTCGQDASIDEARAKELLEFLMLASECKGNLVAIVEKAIGQLHEFPIWKEGVSFNVVHDAQQALSKLAELTDTTDACGGCSAKHLMYQLGPLVLIGCLVDLIERFDAGETIKNAARKLVGPVQIQAINVALYWKSLHQTQLIT